MSEPGSDPERRATNRLARETSAYLRQHMHNPVDWHPWGAAALARAREEDKPLLVSIGYSACHWCHVMERESFEDPETAALMNRLFVNVKVDREERPDVDQIYMDTVVRLTGHGGWPLTLFCTPDGRPFHGGTYFPPEPRHGLPSFRQVLEAVADAWGARRAALEEQAGRIVGVLGARARGVAEALPGRATLVRAARELLAGADREHGGFGSGPKFPTPPNLEALLAAADELPSDERRPLLDFVAFTCREMARRGLYDPLGGGFHRYCVDGHWGIPHFEKMLYDQGQLLRVYAEVWRRTGDDDFAWPIRETFAFLAREMTAPEGGFFASQDADSEGVEGKFYVWTPDEVSEVLGPERGDAFCRVFAVTPEGNFEHGASVLWDLAREPRDAWAAERRELLRARSKRVPPATDRKRLAAWNGYAISGLAYAGSLLGDEPMLDAAGAAAEFVLVRMRDERGRLLRSFDEGRAHVPAFLDDVASLANAALDLHRAGAGERWLDAAVRLADDVARRFFDAGEGDLFLTAEDAERLAVRPRADHDGATPHSTGLALLALVRAGVLAGRADLSNVATRVARTHAFVLERAPTAYPTLARAVAVLERGISVAVVVGDPEAPATRALAARARRILSPEDAVVVTAPGRPAPPGLDPAWTQGRGLVDGRAAAYVCRGPSCSLPVTDPVALAPLASGG